MQLSPYFKEMRSTFPKQLIFMSSWKEERQLLLSVEDLECQEPQPNNSNLTYNHYPYPSNQQKPDNKKRSHREDDTLIR